MQDTNWFSLKHLALIHERFFKTTSSVTERSELANNGYYTWWWGHGPLKGCCLNTFLQIVPCKVQTLEFFFFASASGRCSCWENKSGGCHRFSLASDPRVCALASYGVVVVIVFMLPLQRISARVLRRHVGGDEDVLGANQRWIDEDIGDSRCGGRGCRGERNKVNVHHVAFPFEVLDDKKAQ